MRALLPGAATT